MFSIYRKLVLALTVLPLILAMASFTANAQRLTLNFQTYNIRLATTDDGPNYWNFRKTRVMDAIKAGKPDVVALQEVLYSQLGDVEQAFPAFSRIGAARDDGRTAGEFSPLLFRKDRFRALASGTFWLSQTPSVAGSRGWDAACNRVVSWVKLEHRRSGLQFVAFSTHFDHMGETARRNSALLLLHAVDSLAGNLPAVIMGDFNAAPGSEPYLILTDAVNPLHLTDTRLTATKKETPGFTYSGFEPGTQPGEIIDYILVRNCAAVEHYRVNTVNNGKYYPSDHLPVTARIKLK